jgi:hypothetical protein
LSQNIVRVAKSKVMSWTGMLHHILGEIRTAFRILVKKLGMQKLLWRHGHRQQYNITVNLKLHIVNVWYSHLVILRIHFQAAVT